MFDHIYFRESKLLVYIPISSERRILCLHKGLTVYIQYIYTLQCNSKRIYIWEINSKFKSIRKTYTLDSAVSVCSKLSLFLCINIILRFYPQREFQSIYIQCCGAGGRIIGLQIHSESEASGLAFVIREPAICLTVLNVRIQNVIQCFTTIQCVYTFSTHQNN